MTIKYCDSSIEKQLLDYLSALVAIPSLSGNEKNICEYIIRSMPLPYTYREGNSLVYKIKGHDSSKAFILNGHVDTVALVKNDVWDTDPYTLTIKNKKAHGLGTSDMKAGIAIMLAISNEFILRKPPCDIWILFSESEETDGSGTKKLLQYAHEEILSYSRYGGIILEPTNNTHVEYGHRGNVFVEVTSSGDGGHSSHDYNDKTATSHLLHFLATISSLQVQWREEFTDPVLGQPTINITQLHTNSNSYNIVPTYAAAIIDIRTTPKLNAALSSTLYELSKMHGVDIGIIPGTQNSHGYCDPNTDLYSCALSFFTNKKFTVSSKSTDLCTFTDHSIPMLIYGPGEANVIHTTNEHVSIDKITAGYEDIKQFAEHFSNT
jgi:succinyl-diaminopimelate desuccinylase